ncbi:MAG: class I SAM-dependent methyltransferase [Gemmatimonadales bacterium]
MALTGERKDYYARRRIEWLAGRLGSNARVDRVLDFGCGTGTSVPLLREVLGAREVVGVDPSGASLDRARAEHGGVGVSFALPGEPAAAGPFDLAFCNGVFHHIPPGERLEAVASVVRSLRPGGWFACWENNPLNPGTRIVMRRVAFDRDAIMLRSGELAGLFRRAGLAVVRVDFLFVFPRFLRIFRPLEPFVTALPLGGQYQVLGQRPEQA